MELLLVILAAVCIFVVNRFNKNKIELLKKSKEEYLEKLKKLKENGLFDDDKKKYNEVEFLKEIKEEEFLKKFEDFRIKNEGKDEYKYLPYKIKKTVMTSHERLLFETLKSLLEPKYSVYPQVNLSKIFDIEYQKLYKYYVMWFRKISQKSVDFLVVNKNTQSPLFAIELDDSSHERIDRQERDKFVDEIFKRNNFPLIRFNPGKYKPEELKSVFQKYLN